MLTWRTIQTWFYRYKNHGITGMTPQPRKDKGQTRKVTPEELLEALNAAKPHFHNKRTNKRALYRYCVENALLNPERIAELGLTANEVVTAVRRQNAQVAAGVINGPPYGAKGELQLPINIEGRLSDPEQFK